MRYAFCVIWGFLLSAWVDSQSQRRPNYACGGNLTGESGMIGSEGYPGVYPSNTKCTWKITVPEGRVVSLRFRSIDLESDTLCRYDFVDVYSDHAGGQRLGRFCGTFRPGALVSSTNRMLVQMVSDANTAGSGFLAVFTAAHPNERGDRYCGGRMVKPSGSFKTPNWPERDYPAGVTCTWHFIAPSNQVIELKFEKFDVERDSYCRYDHVAIYNGGEMDENKRIGKFCGDSPPAPVTSEGNQLVVNFLSDLSLTADGFIGHYKFRPRRLRTTAAPVTTPTTSTTVTTAMVKYSPDLCKKKCERNGTPESHFCASSFVIAGTVITTAVREGRVHATVSIISIYKEGDLTVQQAGKSMSTKIVVLCKKCPFIRRGLSYIFMGQTDEKGQGAISPQNYVVAFKGKSQRVLDVLKYQRC